MLERYDDVLTVNDICNILHIGRNTAYQMLRNGDIKCKRTRGKYIIPKFRVIEYLTAYA